MNEFKGGPPDYGRTKEGHPENFDLKAFGERLKRQVIEEIEDAFGRAMHEAEREVEAAQQKYKEQLARLEEAKKEGISDKVVKYTEEGARQIFEETLKKIEEKIKHSLKFK